MHTIKHNNYYAFFYSSLKYGHQCCKFYSVQCFLYTLVCKQLYTALIIKFNVTHFHYVIFLRQYLLRMKFYRVMIVVSCAILKRHHVYFYILNSRPHWWCYGSNYFCCTVNHCGCYSNIVIGLHSNQALQEQKSVWSLNVFGQFCMYTSF